MGEHTIQDVFDNVLRRQSRIETQLSTLTTAQREALDRIKADMHLAISRAMGARENELVTQRLLHGMILQPECIATIFGTVDEMPKTRAEWDAYAKTAIEGDLLAKLYMASSNEADKEQLRQAAREALPSAKRLTMAHNGTLDDYIEGVVSAQLDSRADD